MAHTTVSMMAPSGRSAFTASRTAPPEVMTSSMSVTRLPSYDGPSASLAVPYSLAFLRMNTTGMPVLAETMVAIGMPPISSAPSSSVPSGSSSTICVATRSRRAGWASKRYLSK